MSDDDHRASWHHRLGLQREHREDWLGAVAAFDAAVKLEPARATRHYRLGSAKERIWDYAGARDAYAQATKRAPGRTSWQGLDERVAAAAAAFRPFNGTVIAHRGSRTGTPENAVASLDRLPQYVDAVEIDARVTKDGVPVLMHDRVVDRTTDGSGPVEEKLYAEVAALTGPDGIEIPTLEAYLDASQRGGVGDVMVDVKAATSTALGAVATVVSSSPHAEKCIAMVRSAEQMASFREISGDLRLGCLGVNYANLDERIAAAKECSAEVLLVMHRDQRYLANRGVVKLIKAAGLRAGASTINGREALEAARVDGCDVLVTDRSDQLAYFCGSIGQGSSS